jgi:hypothetical protein
MKINRREAMISLFIAASMWLGLVAIPKWRFHNSYTMADSFCRTIHFGIATSEAVAMAKQDVTKQTLIVEPGRIRLYFGSGCRCDVHFENDKATRSVAWCLG